MTTLVVNGAREINGQRFEHGAELPPGLLPREVVDQWLDCRWLAEYDVTERRSLYRLLHVFSGCTEREPLSDEELRRFTITGNQHSKPRARKQVPDLPQPVHTGCTLL
jgi:hypothetical protein